MNRILAALALAASLGTPFLPVLGSLWDTPAHQKEGFGWDPSGLKSSPPPADTEAGFGWDPSGLHNSPPLTPAADEGFGWDPNG